jgi:hypothetical protein
VDQDLALPEADRHPERRNVRRKLTCLFAIGVVVALLVAGSTANAHDPALSGIRVLFSTTGVIVNVTTHMSRLKKAEKRAAMSRDDMESALRRRLRLLLDGSAPAFARPNVILDPANDLIIWQGRIDHTAKLCEVQSRLYPEDASSRTVVTMIRDGIAVQDALLDSAHPDFMGRRAPVSKWVVAGTYIREGVGHIFGGPDHILFVLGLLLLGGTLKSLIKTVTAFTLAHSITLTIAATGIWNPSPRIVEPLIALSIVAIAVENLRRAGKTAKRDLRPWFAFGFGLIHGFGFAGALAEVGLPKEALGVALASFNIGVEIGQVTIVLAAAPALALLAAKRPAINKRLVFAGSACIGVCGAFWFVSRVLAA